MLRKSIFSMLIAVGFNAFALDFRWLSPIVATGIPEGERNAICETTLIASGRRATGPLRERNQKWSLTLTGAEDIRWFLDERTASANKLRQALLRSSVGRVGRFLAGAINVSFALSSLGIIATYAPTDTLTSAGTYASAAVFATLARLQWNSKRYLLVKDHARPALDRNIEAFLRLPPDQQKRAWAFASQTDRVLGAVINGIFTRDAAATKDAIGLHHFQSFAPVLIPAMAKLTSRIHSVADDEYARMLRTFAYVTVECRLDYDEVVQQPRLTLAVAYSYARPPGPPSSLRSDVPAVESATVH